MPRQFHLSTRFFPPWPPPWAAQEGCMLFHFLEPWPLENLLDTESDWPEERTQDAHGQAGLDSFKPFHDDLPWGAG